MFKTSASLIGSEIDGAFWLITAMCAVLFLAIISLMAYFTVRYRRNKNTVPVDIEGHTGLEALFLASSVVVVLVMFYIGWNGYARLFNEAPEGLFTIKAAARQWSWAFKYPGGVETDRLFIPSGRDVRVELYSADVLHSFYIPAFRVKQDVVPGTVHSVWFRSDAPGEYDLFCAEYCGTGHSMMLSKAVVLQGAEFDSWLSSGEGKGAGGGADIFKAKGCAGCHSVDGSPLVCPTLKSLFGAKVRVRSGKAVKEVVADEGYIRRSILDPGAEVVEGFELVMPSFRSELTDAELTALVAYIRSLE